jgi:hypothetical protein
MSLSIIAKHFPALLGLLFLYSGSHKFYRPGETTYALLALDLPFWLANAAIVMVTATELYLGAILLLKKDLKISLISSTLLMFAFTTFLWYLSTLANPPSCGCLGLTGMFDSSRHDAVFGIFRNFLILFGLKLSYDFYFPKTNSALARAST